MRRIILILLHLIKTTIGSNEVALPVLFVLILVITIPVDGEEGATSIEVSEPETEAVTDPYSPCEQPPAGAVPVAYTFLPITIRDPEEVCEESTPPDIGKEKTGSFVVYDRQIIDTEEEYIRLFGKSSTIIDWENQRILVHESFASYRFDELDYTSALSGVYSFGDYLYIGISTTHHGPCQGIYQDPNWYSFEMNTHFLLIPGVPEKIRYYHCTIGGCPPDIP